MTRQEKTAQAFMTASARATRMWGSSEHTPQEQRQACWEAECARQQMEDANK